MTVKVRAICVCVLVVDPFPRLPVPSLFLPVKRRLPPPTHTRVNVDTTNYGDFTSQVFAYSPAAREVGKVLNKRVRSMTLYICVRMYKIIVMVIFLYYCGAGTGVPGVHA